MDESGKVVETRGVVQSSRRRCAFDPLDTPREVLRFLNVRRFANHFLRSFPFHEQRQLIVSQLASYGCWFFTVPI